MVKMFSVIICAYVCFTAISETCSGVSHYELTKSVWVKRKTRFAVQSVGGARQRPARLFSLLLSPWASVLVLKGHLPREWPETEAPAAGLAQPRKTLRKAGVLATPFQPGSPSDALRLLPTRPGPRQTDNYKMHQSWARLGPCDTRRFGDLQLSRCVADTSL